jgi:hypothetical protein
MHKMSLLLVVLSVCALHAADEKGKAQELLMEHISDLYQFSKYCNKVVAITYASVNLMNPPLLLKDKDDMMPLRYGIISLRRINLNNFYLSSPKFTTMTVCVDLYPFQKNDVERQAFVDFGEMVVKIEFNSKLSDDAKNDFANKLIENGKEAYKERLEELKIKIRLANEEEKRELWQAMFDDQVKCYDLPKSDVLSCLAQN